MDSSFRLDRSRGFQVCLLSATLWLRVTQMGISLQGADIESNYGMKFQTQPAIYESNEE